MRIDMSLDNAELYADCKIGEVVGRKNLETPVSEAASLVGRNVQRLLVLAPDDRDEVILTGPMAVWAYLVVFHSVLHRFGRVLYDDGRNPPVLVAAHGPRTAPSPR